MAAMRANPRQEITEQTTTWISGERNTAQQWAESEVEGFTFAARNEVEWLNEHMAEIFSQNESKFADMFKTPGKLRGKTPRTARKINPLEPREPLSDVFSASSRAGLSPFRQAHFDRPVASFRVAEDEPAKQEAPRITEASSQRMILTFDSGYHGSQSDNATEADEQENALPLHKTSPLKSPSHAPVSVAEVPQVRESEGRRTTEGSFKSAREDQTKIMDEVDIHVDEEMDVDEPEPAPESPTIQYPVLESPLQSKLQQSPTPQRRSPLKSIVLQSPERSPERSPEPVAEPASADEEEEPAQSDEVEGVSAPDEVDETEPVDDVQSPSEASSPIRPIVRKSSLNFASLPAREPITTKKSIGNRISRTSHLDQTRMSYYGRQTGGKSLGNVKQDQIQDDEMDVDSVDENGKSDPESMTSQLHNKTSTQRLQDQISMLGQSKATARPSKSFAGSVLATSQATQPSQAPVMEPQYSRSPVRQDRPFTAPGAFPDDEDDSWIGPSAATIAPTTVRSPRPVLEKCLTTDVMENIHGKESIGGAQFSIPKRGEASKQGSPAREATSPAKSPSGLGRFKSVSTSFIRSPKKSDDSLALSAKQISVSNPNPALPNEEEESTTPPKSPSRMKGSPLKAAKDKFSSILKTSRGLFASSAAVSAEAKNSAYSPGLKTKFSFEEPRFDEDEPMYPSLEKHLTNQSQAVSVPPASPTRSIRKTRASTEREEKRKEEVSKEARRMEEQLQKARSKVQEEARQHHMEQEKVAAMEKQIAARKEQEKAAKASQAELPKPTRSSPRKTKAQLEAEGIAAAAVTGDSKEFDVPEPVAAMPPPSLPRPKTASQIGRPGLKRPLKPAKEAISKAKAPTVIRVDTGSQRGHQYHPSNASLSASLQDSLSSSTTSSQGAQGSQGMQGSQGALKSKASSASLHSKTSSTSFKSGASKALEAAARKKEQDDLAIQRKKEAKLEMERQRAAIKEEERRQQEQQRRQEAERQREIQREREHAAGAAEAKKAASRQALEKKKLEMEKAKQTRAPPPAMRHQATTSELSYSQEKALPPLPPQRADTNQAKPTRPTAGLHRSQDDLTRTMPHNNKAPPKRPLQQENDDHHSRPQLPRNGPSYQQNETNSKRRKTSENFDDDDSTEHQPRMMAPPIRQSSVRQKELPTKSLFPSGYANAPVSSSTLQRTTLISQHNMNQSKPAHPMDLAQVSKAPIAFASSASQATGQIHKTPARPAGVAGGAKSTAKSAKSAAKSSPRYQNGESIELPEINTDSEDEDSDADNDFVALPWTDSLALQKQLAMQETIDPQTVFGQSGPLVMEEVFSKSKDRFHKFRARTSSANWSGQDRLTEDEVKKDLEARDRVRRQGGWTYDSMIE
ncbi:inner centromere protein [Phlyctema vagabunda]|uniref:Inner centromere protein n=1 Tax=Phlyctema vagabunda TaxID=108571 RepID=A0ABR4PCQ0_9HELO